METNASYSTILNGVVIYLDREEAVADLPWNAHAKFRNVYLKHLVKGADTEGRFSCHLVKIDPNAVLEDHIHENNFELHEVMEGNGTFTLETKEAEYYPGSVGLIPQGKKHSVMAGENGLLLMAKFFPALV
jgi:mannose-6-phosphate isomerase-like protein (cupin superfamily)